MSKMRMLLAMVGAIAALAIATSAATAATISPGGNFTGTSAQNLTLGTGSTAIACNLTFTGTLATSISIPGTIGSVTTAAGGGCTNTGILSFPANPQDPAWTIDQTGLDVVTGLPLLSIGNIDMTLSYLGGLVSCHYAGLTTATVNTNPATQIVFTGSLPFVSGSSLCPKPEPLSGFLSLDTAQTLAL